MPNTEELIRRYGPSFCVLPWKHLHLCDTGACKICCATSALRDQFGRRLTVYKNPLETIWNSEAMREVRRAMVAGEMVPDCAYCRDTEALGGYSRRLRENQSWETGWVAREGVSIADLKAEAGRNDYFVPYAPFDMDIEIDNRCNLSCRMCGADRSSRIENDPVHRRWAGRLQTLPRWADNEMALAPERVIDGIYVGFYPAGDVQKAAALWTRGKAEIRLPEVNERLTSLEIRLTEESIVRELRLFLNDALVYESAGSGIPRRDITVDLGSYYQDLCLRFESDTVVSPDFNGPLGVGLLRLAVRRDKKTRPASQLMYSRFPARNHWMMEDDFLFKELFPPGVKQKGLKIVGGEPLFNPNVLRVLHHLAEKGDSRELRISFTTNGTVYNEKVFRLAKKFKCYIVAVSIDAIGPGLEYIRHGVRWRTLEKNIGRMASTRNVHLIASTTLQAYNALEIVEVFRFCDRSGLECFSSVVVNPGYLGIAVLPPEVRTVAARRLKAYIDDGRPGFAGNKQSALTLAHALESPATAFAPAELRRFMLFNNDLDRSRKENIRDAFPELVDLIERAGYPWIGEYLFCEG